MKRLFWIAVLVPMGLTYGSIYSTQQHQVSGLLSHQYNAKDHLAASELAIFPPMWIVAPFITDGYKDGFQFVHHHTRFCLTVHDFDNHDTNHCELEPDCDPVLRDSPCPDESSSMYVREENLNG